MMCIFNIVNDQDQDKDNSQIWYKNHDYILDGGQETFFHFTASRPSPGITQPLTQVL
jgi:hypothetical protein